MPRVKGARHRIDQQKCDVEREVVTALDPAPISFAVCEPLKLDVSVKLVDDRALVACAERKGVVPVDRNSGLSPDKVGGRGKRGNELRVELDAEGVDAVLCRSDLSY